jgi:hypothetical protein
MLDGTDAFARWVKLGDAHLRDGGKETQMADMLWWADAIDPDRGAGRLAL